MKTLARETGRRSGARIDRETRTASVPMSLIMIVCSAILVVGFFFAAKQHFASIEFGIKNSRLRSQIDELEAEKRRLLLAKEVALSPGEIKKAARRIGFTKMTAANIELVQASAAPAAEPEMPIAIPANDRSEMEIKARIVKTVMTGPVVSLAQNENKSEKHNKAVNSEKIDRSL